MKKMFTKLFGLMLLMVMFSMVGRAQVPPNECGLEISLDDSNVELVTALSAVCDSSLVTFKVVGDFADTTYYAFNHDGNWTGGFTDNPTFKIEEGKMVYIQVMEVVDGDTCISDYHEFLSEVVSPIVIEEPTAEHPMCGNEMGEVTAMFSGGYDSDYLAASGIEYPYLYSIVPKSAWGGPNYYPAYTDVSPNFATGADTFYVAVFENKDTSLVCLTDLLDIASWDSVVVNETTPAVVLDTIMGVDPVCAEGTGSVTVIVHGGSGDTLMVDLMQGTDDVYASLAVTNDTAVFTDVPEGTYFAIVTDSVGCDDESAISVTLTAPAAVKFDIAIKSIDCFGGNNGEITVQIDPSTYVDTITYEALIVSLDTTDKTVYTWTSLDGDSLTIDGLWPVYYALYVRDSTNGCDSVPYENPNEAGNFISLQSPGDITFDVVFENDMDSIPCLGDSMWVWLDNVDGGSGSYEVQLERWAGLTLSTVLTSFNDDVEKWYLPAVYGSNYYKVIVQDSLVEASCDTDTTFIITGNEPVQVNAETTDPICAGQSDGLITIYASGGTGIYEYSIDSINWYNYNTFNVPAGIYRGFARDAVCPTNLDWDTEPVNEIPNVIEIDTHDTDPIICNGAATAKIEVDLVSWSYGYNAEAIYERNIRAYYTTDIDDVFETGTELERNEVHWDAGLEWTAEDLTAGTYYIWAVDTFGCVFDTLADGTRDYLTVVIDEYDPLDLVVDVVDSASCSGTNDGLIKLTMSGGNQSMLNLFMGGLVVSEEKSATLESRDDDNTPDCFGSFMYGIAPTYQQALLKDPSSMTCWPVENIPAQVSESQEKSASVDPSYAEEVYIQVTGGEHWVVLYDSECGDRVIRKVDVAGHGEVVIGDVVSVTDIVCYDANTGEIKLKSPKGGSGTLVYTLYKDGTSAADTVDGYVGVTDTVFSELYAGTYYVEVTDLGPATCEGDWTDAIEIIQPNLIFTAVPSDITCFGNADGEVVLRMENAEGGAPMFKLGTANWKPFDTYLGHNVWTKNVTILEPGIGYEVTAIDTAGYLAGCDGTTRTFDIMEPPVLTIEAIGDDSTTCSTIDDGFITVTISGGKADSVEIEIIDDLEAVVQTDTVYIYSGTDATYTFGDLENGVYSLVLTELGVDSPCEMTEEDIAVYDEGGIVAEVTDFTSMVSCKGDSTGIIELSITGGTGTYIVQLNGETVTLDENDQITGLPAGAYEVYIRDEVKSPGNDTICEWTTPATDSVRIGEPEEYLSLGVTKIQDLTCQDSGMFSLQAAGGTPGYEYYAAISKFPQHILLPDPDSDEWLPDSIFSVPEAGTWVVWVKDAAGCIVGGEYDDNDVEINEWRVPILDSTVNIEVVATIEEQIQCNGGDATVIVYPSDVEIDGVVGAREYTVWFTDLEENVLAENDTLVMGSATDTTYFVAWVKDTESGCVGSDTVEIVQPKVLEAIALELGDGEFTCPEAIEGYMEAVATGGTKPYKYQIWKNGKVFTPAYQTNYSFLAKVDSTYSFVVMDYNGCTDTLDVPVKVESAEPITFTVDEITCFGDPKGSIRVTATGEEGRSFKVKWTQIEDNVPVDQGTSKWFTETIDIDTMFIFDDDATHSDSHYEITVFDTLGCESAQIDTMTFNDEIQASVSVVVEEGEVSGCGTEVTITPAGGVPPYTVWVDDVVTTEMTIVLGGGVHDILVQDSHVKCEAAKTITLDYPLARVDSVWTYTGETVDYSDVEAGLDTALEAGTHEFTYDVDETCENTLTVVVSAKDRSMPALVEVSPTDTLEDNHPTFEIVFDGDVFFNDSVAGYLTVTPEGETEPYMSIMITEPMVVGNTITVTYVVGEGELGLDKNTTYVVAVDSGVVVGDGLTWDGDVEGELGEWKFTTGPDWATEIVPGLDAIEFNVYPNPFDSYIKIDNYDKLTRVVMTNIAGQRVLDIENPSSEIQTGELVTGVYIITLFDGNNIVESARIIKR